MFGAVAVLALLVLWTGFRLLSARSDLAEAQRSAQTLRTTLTSADASSDQALSSIQASVASAKSDLNDPVVVIASKVPILGRNIAAPREIANVLDDLARNTIPDLVGIAGQMQPSKIMVGGGRIDLDVLESSAAGLEQSSVAMAAASDRLDRIKTKWTLPPIGNGVREVQDAVGEAAGAVATGARFAKVGPTMLGGEGTKRYLLISQNNAEVRSTGGLPGAWSEIVASDGKLTLGELGSAHDMNTTEDPATPISFQEENLYTSKLVTDFRDVNFIPDFPRAAQIAEAMASKRVGLNVDGVVSIDPVTLSYLLKATGPVQPKFGDRLTADNAVATLLNGVYLKYEKNEQQDAYFAAATAAVFDAITKPSINAKALGEALSKATNERRIMLWSNEPDLQEQLAGTAIAHELSSGASERPKIGFYLNDVSAAKMEYYLSYSSTVEATKCSSDGRQTYAATLTFSSSAPPDAANLPEYITGGTDRAYGLKPGSMTFALNTFAPNRGKVTKVTFRGEKADPRYVTFAPATWKGRGVGQSTITLAPGETKTLDIEITSGPDSRGDTDVALTPSSKPNTESAYVAKSRC